MINAIVPPPSASLLRIARGLLIALTLLFIALGGPLTPAAAAPLSDKGGDPCLSGAKCVTFDGLPLGATYVVGDLFADPGALVSVKDFQWSNGVWTSAGITTVGNGGVANGSGHEIQPNNVNLAFDFGGPVNGLALRFAEYGGNLNIDINGDFVNFKDFPDIHGLVIGGVNVTVIVDYADPNGAYYEGRLLLSGVISSFMLGGQELWLDDICPEPDCPCVMIESQSLGAVYVVGDVFADAGATIGVKDFQWANGVWTSAGVTRVENGGMAGGAGNELQVNNVNLAFDFGTSLTGLTLRFGEYGGNLNIEINGDFVNFANFADIDGATIGGVLVSVVNGFGNDQGQLTLSGPIHSFAVGGQELWIDDICPSYER